MQKSLVPSEYCLENFTVDYFEHTFENTLALNCLSGSMIQVNKSNSFASHFGAI
jgi:hypothetical protein